MTRSKVYYIMGVSGCGKSTIGKLLAQACSVPFYDGDDYHPQTNIDKMSAGIPLDDKDRHPWLEKINQVALESINQNGCVIACSALKATYRTILSHNIERDTTYIYLKGSYDMILNRMKLRNHFMPPDLLRSQFDTLEEPSEAVIVSIEASPESIIRTIIDATTG